MPENIDDFIYGEFSARAIGARLALTREVLGLRQVDFGARVGIKRSMYNQIEGGHTMLSPEKAYAICEYYDLTMDWIYRGDPSAMSFQMADSIARVYHARKRLPPKQQTS